MSTVVARLPRVPGNSGGAGDDLTVVDCERCREAISAGLDGEAGVRETARAEAHLAGCAACRTWAQLAAVVTRRVRTRPADPAPDLVSVLFGPDPTGHLRPACGCAASCGCGCQQGLACRCAPRVA
ncbi:zf-HC2 domain-containing protein [Actinomycetospora soli]|uniref:zf-HC2 domain-containing protein n=1 Tax=Actinomycetospora soli TaxID=2893887 RepID=UPI001E2EECB2|nr:zf-HC2 domain-containing protein [Actinomycetospora soli]MCD2189838.1 zf-HC2 domain-containing protein [Actinomycetospora soli]